MQAYKITVRERKALLPVLSSRNVIIAFVNRDKIVRPQYDFMDLLYGQNSRTL